MALPSSYPFLSARNKSPRFVPKTADNAPTRIRLRLCLPQHYQRESAIAQLIAKYGITVFITGTKLEHNSNDQCSFDLELKGTPEQLQAGIAYLQALNIKIKGKANPSSDGWHY